MIKFFKQFVIYSLGTTLAKLSSVFLLPVFTNVFTREEYGVIATIIACKGIIDLFSNLNIHAGIARDYYTPDINKTRLVSTGFISILSFSVLTIVFFYISRNFWVSSVLSIGNYEKAFIIMLLTIPADSLYYYFAILVRLKQKSILFLVGSIIQLTVQIAAKLFFILYVKIGVIGIFYGLLLGQLVGIVYFIVLNREHIAFSFDKKLLQKVLLFSLPALPAILASWINSSLGQLFIGKFSSLEDAGVYNVALQISSVFLLIYTAFGNVWTPYIFSNFEKPTFKHEVNRLFNYVVIILLVVFVNVALLSKQVVLLLSNSNYIKASDYIILLCMAYFFSILVWFANIGPNIIRKTKYISYASITGSIINFALMLIFIPKFGVIMAPVSLIISHIIGYAISSYFTYKQTALLFSVKNVVFAVIGMMLCYLFRIINNNEIINIILLVIFNIAILTYIIRKMDLKMMIRKIIN